MVFFQFFDQYMDDIIRSIKQNVINDKLTMINNFHDNRKFTIDIISQRIAFLAMMLIQNDKIFTFTWICGYCELIDTGLI